MKKRHAIRKRNSRTSTVGSEIIRGLTGLRDALSGGARIEERFTVKTVALELDPREWTARDVKGLRNRLNASQAVFAKLLGASIKTVQAWEQGSTPPPMARRLLECIEKDCDSWKRTLERAAKHRAAA